MLASLSVDDVITSEIALKWNTFVITQNDENLRVLFANALSSDSLADSCMFHVVGPNASLKYLGNLTIFSDSTHKIVNSDGFPVPNMSILPYEFIKLKMGTQVALQYNINRSNSLALFRIVQIHLDNAKNFVVRDDLIISNDDYCGIRIS